MSDLNSFEYDPSGGAIIIEFHIQLLIADWYVKRSSGTESELLGSGRTDDNVADVVAIDKSKLSDGASFLWSALLYGPDADTDYNVKLYVMQNGNTLGKVERSGKLPARTARQETGTIKFSPKAGA